MTKSKTKNRYKLEKDIVIGGWKLVERLGVGGNGEVWEVSRNDYENHAMKLLKTTDTNIYERFKAETHILSTIKHDGVIPLINLHLPDDIKQTLLGLSCRRLLALRNMRQTKHQSS